MLSSESSFTLQLTEFWEKEFVSFMKDGTAGRVLFTENVKELSI